VTRDHTYVQTLIDSGRITADEALVHPRRNLVMRAIDGVHPAEPDVSVREARAGDRYLVCSDGLCGYVSDDRIHELLELADPVAVVTALVDAALEAGAPDNVTCVVADVVTADGVTEPDLPVVVGAAGEPRNRERLPGFSFPADAQLDPRTATVVRVNTGSDGAGSDVHGLADVYREEQGAPRRRTPWRWIAALVVVALIVGGLVAVTSAWARNQFFVGTDAGYVAIYRGVPGELGPISLHTLEERTQLTVDSLPDFEASQVQGTIAAADLASAEAIVQRLGERASQCTATPSTPGCPNSGTPSPVGSASPPTGTDATALPSASASP
jgi:protein phosphatase